MNCGCLQIRWDKIIKSPWTILEKQGFQVEIIIDFMFLDLVESIDN